ncbi:DNA repair protein RadA [Myxococcota bacterium]|nr:DNA repair protein RadA [Myxococcota bacterium]
MAKPRSHYACTACGAQSPRWVGRCPDCGAWSSMVEEPDTPAPHARSSARAPFAGPDAVTGPLALGDIAPEPRARLATDLPELDRVLGGGLVPGSAVLLGGEPGIGKSTLALQVAAATAERQPPPSASPRGSSPGKPSEPSGQVLYVSGEESPEQIRLRAGRLPVLPASLLVLAETRVEAIADAWRTHAPKLVLVDSIQTLQTERVESAAGSVAQVRESAADLIALAKSSGAVLILVGHVTKEGTLAGPRVLEHLVDVVLAFEGDRGQSFRVLRAAKNRFGSTLEVGVFSMGESGLAGVANPSELFLAERRGDAPGSCVVALLEGTRPLLLEVQALVAPAGYGTARRTAIGFDDGRLALLLAVLARRGGIDVLGMDVYLNVTGGMRIGEPAADLAVILALASSRLDVALPPDAIAVGEVGLGGEVRRVGRVEARVQEAMRLGFRRVLMPRGGHDKLRANGMELVPVEDVAEAVRWLRCAASAPGRDASPRHPVAPAESARRLPSNT